VSGFGSIQVPNGATTNASAEELGHSRRTVNVTEDGISHENSDWKRKETEVLPVSISSCSCGRSTSRDIPSPSNRLEMDSPSNMRDSRIALVLR